MYSVSQVSYFADLATIFGFLLGALGAALAFYQLFELRKSKQAELRPYLTVYFEERSSRNGQEAVLVLHNSGRTSALNVRLEFEKDRAAHYIRPADFPFFSQFGIAAIQPGDTLKFLMGRLRTGSAFDQILEKPIEAKLYFDAEGFRKPATTSILVYMNSPKYQIST